MEEDRTEQLPDGWPGLQEIATLHRLNASHFAMLAEVARTETSPGERSPIYRELELWKRVDDRACERAGRCPVLLLSLNFERLDWWKRISPRVAIIPTVDTHAALFDDALSGSILREILMEAWRLGRSLPSTATLLFGMARGVSAEISRLPVLEVDRIAVDYAKDLRPRWEENKVFWRNLLHGATGTDDGALVTVHLYCLQLLGGHFELR